ncbi:MAG: type II toxin-antitoxin system RelE family toxin [Mycobacteriales bacterium]
MDDPRSLGEPLKGSRLGDLWKYRVGDWRVIAEIQDESVCVLILQVGHRREIYRPR